jgi:hypothetical protein
MLRMRILINAPITEQSVRLLATSMSTCVAQLQQTDVGQLPADEICLSLVTYIVKTRSTAHTTWRFLEFVVFRTQTMPLHPVNQLVENRKPNYMVYKQQIAIKNRISKFI